MLRVGLTGGIGCGKTTVANLFMALGVPVLDTDIISREVVAPKSPVLATIVTRYGNTILDQHGSLNRRQLREIIFNDTHEKRWLEQLLHPLIRQRLQQQLATLHAPYCILVIPLLLENKRAIEVERVLVIDTPTDVQIKRIQQRDHITTLQAQQILAHQLNREQRLASADDIILNDAQTTPTALQIQVEKLHQFYLDLSQPFKS